MNKSDLQDIIRQAIVDGTSNTSSTKNKIDRLSRKTRDIDREMSKLKSLKKDVMNQIKELQTHTAAVNSMICILNNAKNGPRKRMEPTPEKVWNSNEGRTPHNYIAGNRESGRETIGSNLNTALTEAGITTSTTGKRGPKVGSTWSKEHRENYEATLRARQKNQ